MKHTVKIGLLTLDKPMTLDGARRYGKRAMPADLKRAGFETFVGVAPAWLTGAETDYLRISYGKAVR